MSWILVALGGAVGAVARYSLTLWLAPPPGKFPLATFSANMLGCFAMGILYVLIVHKALIPVSWRPFLTIGMLGAFTTFSTFSLEALWLWQHEHFGLAATYVVATVAGCLLAVWAGYFCCESYLSP